jgi:hypothetical protein
MKTIWKYDLTPIANRFELLMPVGAIILTLQLQDEKPVLWALVDSEAKKERREFRLLMTGQPFELQGNYRYIGTYQFQYELVFHIFEQEKP